MPRAWRASQRPSGDSPGPRPPAFAAGKSALSAGLWSPRAFRPAAFASGAFLGPLRVGASLPRIVGLTGTRPDRNGVACFAPARRGGGGCLLYPGAWVSRRTRVSGVCAVVGSGRTSEDGPVSLETPPRQRPIMTGPRRRFAVGHPTRLSLACGPRWQWALGLPPPAVVRFVPWRLRGVGTSMDTCWGLWQRARATRSGATCMSR